MEVTTGILADPWEVDGVAPADQLETDDRVPPSASCSATMRSVPSQVNEAWSCTAPVNPPPEMPVMRFVQVLELLARSAQ
jgi:hypothetical protein